MKRYLIFILFVLNAGCIWSQDHKIFNIERLKQKSTTEKGVKAFTSSKTLIMSGITDQAVEIKEIAAFENVILLDYYSGFFGVRFDTTFGFIKKETLIIDFKIESYQSVWENKVLEEIKEDEIRQRIIRKEEEWNTNFSDAEYASAEPKYDKSAKNPFNNIKSNRITAYNFSLSNERSTSIIKNGELNPLTDFPGRELTGLQQTQLFDIITDTNSYGRKHPKLFTPKIGIVIYGEKNSVVGFIDIDLDNMQIRSTIYVPSVNYHNYYVDEKRKRVDGENPPENAKLVDLTGFSKKGKEKLMEYFRKLKLNVSSYPKTFQYGVDLSYSYSKYIDSIQKVTPSLVVSYSRHSLSLGPRIWLGHVYGRDSLSASGLQLTYKYYMRSYGRKLKFFLFGDIDFSYLTNKKITDMSDYKIIDKYSERFMNVTLGVGGHYKIYGGLHVHAEAGIGYGFAGLTYLYDDPANPSHSYKENISFFEGFFWDSPSYMLKAGLYYQFIK